MCAPAGVLTVPKVRFGSFTLHVIQLDVSTARAKVRPSQDRNNFTTAKLSAYNTATDQTEEIITDCAPFAFMVNFNPPGALVPSRYQSQLWIF